MFCRKGQPIHFRQKKMYAGKCQKTSAFVFFSCSQRLRTLTFAGEQMRVRQDVVLGCCSTKFSVFMDTHHPFCAFFFVDGVSHGSMLSYSWAGTSGAVYAVDW